MQYDIADNLNNLIRWAVYAHGYEFDDCLNTNYTELASRLANTDWETSAYPRRNAFFFIYQISAENISNNFSVRAYSYLRCSQIAAFRITSDYEMTAFPSLLDAEYHYNFCEDIFGERYANLKWNSLGKVSESIFNLATTEMHLNKPSRIWITISADKSKSFRSSFSRTLA